jgi:glyoxylate reductase
LKPKVFVTNELLKPAMDLLHENCDVELHPDDRILTKEELIKGVEGKDALVCLLTQNIDKDIMDANPNLKVIANVAVGFNNVDVGYATSKGIPVTNTPGVLTDTTADLAFTLMVSASRRITESERYLRTGKWHGWGLQQFLGHDIYGKTLGVVGFGRIGKAVAKRAALGFNMDVIYYDVVDHDVDVDFNATKVGFDELLEKSDFITIHVPLLETTTHLFSTPQFEKMKETSILVNTSRGPIVDEKALVEALKNNVIASVGLDVFENEPMVEPGLLELDNLVIVPHVGSATVETRTKMAMMAVTNLIEALEGKVPTNIVNKEVYGGN